MKRLTKVGLLVAAFAFLAFCAIVTLAALVIFRAEWLSFPPRAGGGDQIILGVPGHRDESDYYLLRVGQDVERGTLLAEDAGPGPGTLTVRQFDRDRDLGASGHAGFVPDSRYVLYQYATDNKTVVYRLAVNRTDPSLIFDTKSTFTFLNIRAMDDGDTIFIREGRNLDRSRCYVSQDGTEAIRVGRADDCRLSLDGSTILLSDATRDGLSLTAINIDGTHEVRLLEDEEDIDSFQISGDGSRIAYVQSNGGDQVQLVMISRQDGSLIGESDVLTRLVAYAFLDQGNALFYIAEDLDGELILYTLDAENTEIASGSAIDVSFSGNRDYLVYFVGDEYGESTIYVHPPGGAEEIELVSGDDIGFAILPSPERILITERNEDELTVYSAEITGENLIELFDEDSIYGFSAEVVPGESTLYLYPRGADNSQSLFITPMDADDGFFLLEDWAEIRVLNRSSDGGRLILAAREDMLDDETLYLIEVAEAADPVELDDDAVYLPNAVFMPGGNEILYTATTGPDRDEVEVRRVHADGQKRHEVLYEESFLVDVNWDHLQLFADGSVSLLVGESRPSVCPDALPITVGEALESELAVGGEDCYRLRLERPGDFTISVSSPMDIDTQMDVFDRQGNLLDTDDDSGPGLSPRLGISFEERGTYYIVIQGYGTSDAGTYTISVTEGFTEPTLSSAVPLPFDETLAGAITAESEVYLEAFDEWLYGTMYYFDGQADEWIIIDARAYSIGSSLEPGLMLFDPNMEILTYAESGTTGPDPYLESWLPATGRYYVLVYSLMLDYGSPESYYYEISLTRGTPPEPGGGPISYGEMRDGYLQTSTGDEWTFNGAAGDFITISVTSDSLDSTLELLGPEGDSLAYDDDSGGNVNARISGFRLPATGTYTIIARGYGGSTGPYTLSLMQAEWPATPTPSPTRLEPTLMPSPSALPAD